MSKEAIAENRNACRVEVLSEPVFSMICINGLDRRVIRPEIIFPILGIICGIEIDVPMLIKIA